MDIQIPGGLSWKLRTTSMTGGDKMEEGVKECNAYHF
jgi:hypothetical protein